MGHQRSDSGPVRGLAIRCPICFGKQVETARRLKVARGYVLTFRHGEYTEIGCCECVSRQAKKEFTLNCLLGWWSPHGLLYTPFALLQNAANFTKRPNIEVLEHVVKSAFDLKLADLVEGEDGLSESNRRLLRMCASAIGAVAAADGRSGEEWDAAIVALVELSDHDLQPSQAEALLDQNRNRQIDATRLDDEQRLVVLSIAIQVAAADDEISPSEHHELLKVAKALGFDEEVLLALLRMAGSNNMAPDSRRAAAATVLGVEPTASIGEIRSAWKRLAVLHHPDRAAPEDRMDANAKMAEINDAYNFLLGTSVD